MQMCQKRTRSQKKLVLRYLTPTFNTITQSLKIVLVVGDYVIAHTPRAVIWAITWKTSITESGSARYDQY